MNDNRICRCGHNAAAHEHYRAGSDCGACAGSCVRFRSPSRTVAALARLRDALHRPAAVEA